MKQYEPSLIQTPFGASSTAAEVIEGIDLSAQRVIVTGGSSGLGVETARALAAAGAEVTLAVRNTQAGAQVAAAIAASAGSSRIRVASLDLADRASITRFLASRDGPLHVLVNNAGGILPTLERTAEGWEKQFATNQTPAVSRPTPSTRPTPAGSGRNRSACWPD
jgi:NAD(P)-dependent dehydrogenase (short-subunit alcohol dehydrogenase family)